MSHPNAPAHELDDQQFLNRFTLSHSTRHDHSWLSFQCGVTHTFYDVPQHQWPDLVSQMAKAFMTKDDTMLFCLLELVQPTCRLFLDLDGNKHDRLFPHDDLENFMYLLQHNVSKDFTYSPQFTRAQEAELMHDEDDTRDNRTFNSDVVDPYTCIVLKSVLRNEDGTHSGFCTYHLVWPFLIIPGRVAKETFNNIFSKEMFSRYRELLKPDTEVLKQILVDTSDRLTQDPNITTSQLIACVEKKVVDYLNKFICVLMFKSKTMYIVRILNTEEGYNRYLHKSIADAISFFKAGGSHMAVVPGKKKAVRLDAFDMWNSSSHRLFFMEMVGYRIGKDKAAKYRGHKLVYNQKEYSIKTCLLHIFNFFTNKNEDQLFERSCSVPILVSKEGISKDLLLSHTMQHLYGDKIHFTILQEILDVELDRKYHDQAARLSDDEHAVRVQGTQLVKLELQC
eukprot:m51a1_g11495 hypothetical protein (452) ;mRNA; f:34-1860